MVRWFSVIGALLLFLSWSPSAVFAEDDDDETKVRIHEGDSVVIICNDWDNRADFLRVLDQGDDSARLECSETRFHARSGPRPQLMNYPRQRGWQEGNWQRRNGWRWGRFSYEDDQRRIHLDPGERITLKCRNARKTDLESQRWGPRVLVFSCDRD